MGGIWGGFVGFLEQAVLWCAQLTGSVGFGIILFTIFARVAILPLSISSIKSSRRMQEVQPLLKDVQRKYGKDQQKLQEETMRIYRENRVNPVGGCLPLLLQLPIFFGVYQAVYHLMVEEQRVNLSAAAQAALQDPAIATLFATPFLNFLDLGRATWGPPPFGFNGLEYLILPIMSVCFQYVQQLMATPRVQDPQQKAMMQVMMFMPLIFAYIAFTFPSGAVLYWVTSSLIGIVQQYFTAGWGSLANYLKFLPADGRPNAGVVTVNAVPEEAQAGQTAVAESTRRDFWSVMKPLTETELTPAVATSGATETPPTSTVESPQSRPNQNRNNRNPRRKR